MGPQSGGISAHLDQLSAATARWLQFEDQGDAVGQDALLLNQALENTEEPEMPEALAYLRESRRFGLPLTEGTLYDMPSLFRLELNAVLSAESEFFALKATNARLAAEHASQPGQAAR